MSEANGTVHTDASADSVKPVNRLPKAKKAVTGTDAFYLRMGALCAKKTLTLTASDVKGKVTLSLKTFPVLTADAITEAAAGGVGASFTPTDKIDGKTVKTVGAAEGVAGTQLAEAFFSIPNDE